MRVKEAILGLSVKPIFIVEKKKNHLSSLSVLVGLPDMKSDCQLSLISDLQISGRIHQRAEECNTEINIV